MAGVSSWKKWLEQERFKSVAVSEQTHELLRDAAYEAGLSMKQTADMALRFFLSHTRGQTLMRACKGMTLADYDAKANAADDALIELLGDSIAPGFKHRGSGMHMTPSEALSSKLAAKLKSDNDDVEPAPAPAPAPRKLKPNGAAASH